MIISTDEEACDKVQHPFIIKKNTQESGNRGSIPQHNKGHKKNKILRNKLNQGGI